jgi:hypothetical protein
MALVSVGKTSAVGRFSALRRGYARGIRKHQAADQIQGVSKRLPTLKEAEADRCSFLSCVAAVVTLCGLFTSPLTQQAIEYVANLAPSANGTASIDRTTTFSLYNGSDLALGKRFSSC